MTKRDAEADSEATGERPAKPRPVSGRRIYFSQSVAPSGCVVTSPVASGLIHDWDAAFAHIERALERADTESAPASSSSSTARATESRLRGRKLLIVDGALAPRGAREQWAVEAIEHRGATGVCFIREPAAIW